MIEVATSLEASALATALRQSVWVYPLVNAGHILGIGLLIGSVIPMDFSLLRHGQLGPLTVLRRYAFVRFCLAVLCGGLLFAVEATDYIQNDWFLAKITLILLACLNAGRLMWQPRNASRQRFAAAASLFLWVSALICGRMIAYW